MNQVPDGPPFAGRVARCIAVAVVLALGATACGARGNDSGSGGDRSSATTDVKKAQTAVNAGLEAHSTGDLSKATASYEQALKYDSTNKYALYNLALIDEAAVNYGLAEEKDRKARESDPKYEPALFNLAILVTSRDPKEAVSLYQRAVAVERKDASAWLNLGLLLRAAGDKAEGDKAVAKAVSLNPKLVDPAE